MAIVCGRSEESVDRLRSLTVGAMPKLTDMELVRTREDLEKWRRKSVKKGQLPTVEEQAVSHMQLRAFTRRGSLSGSRGGSGSGGVVRSAGDAAASSRDGDARRGAVRWAEEMNELAGRGGRAICR